MTDRKRELTRPSAHWLVWRRNNAGPRATQATQMLSPHSRGGGCLVREKSSRTKIQNMTRPVYTYLSPWLVISKVIPEWTPSMSRQLIVLVLMMN